MRFLVALACLWALWPSGAPRRENEAASSSEPSRSRSAPEPHTVAAVQRAPTMAPRTLEVAHREGRRERAREALSSFLDRTRYPPGSRPIAERPELAQPDFVPARSLPVGEDARGRRRVVLTQDRMDVAPGESAAVTISCLEGRVEVPCSLDQAHWHTLAPEHTGTLAFRAAGANGGVWSAELRPAALGLGGLSLPLFVETRVFLGGLRGGRPLRADPSRARPPPTSPERCGRRWNRAPSRSTSE
jgi:hypothetical protein